MKLWISGCVAALFVLTSQPLTAAIPQRATTAQHFICNAGYALQKCREDLEVLRRGLDPDSPAVTYYEKHETFIEEALVAEVPGRRGKLLIEWGMSIQDLLDLAIAHELGHALCNEKDEAKANRVARRLQSQQPFACEFKLATKGRSKETGEGR